MPRQDKLHVRQESRDIPDRQTSFEVPLQDAQVLNQVKLQTVYLPQGGNQGSPEPLLEQEIPSRPHTAVKIQMQFTLTWRA